MSFWIFRSDKPHRSKRAPRRSVRLEIEKLEARTVPYTTTGNAWPNPQLITISFEPDGTDLGGVSSNLFATFNGHFGSTAPWENAILKAAQSWAANTNINFSVVSDNGTGSGGGNYQQGDPGMGDIRIGGSPQGTSSYIAIGDMPPPVNNYSIAGDIMFNTSYGFNINGSAYDLYTVAAHELGHALGLGHSTDPYPLSVMYPYYGGTMHGLGTDDILGIQSIYGGARAPDAYGGLNATMATAADITSQIDPNSLTAVVNALDINTTTAVEYFSFTAPSNSNSSMTVGVQSSGLSLLAPSLKIYNSAGTLLGSATGSGELGATLSKSVSITPGQTYYVRVAGANSTVFGTGNYALTLNLGTGPNPSVPLPNTQLPDGNPISGGGGMADQVDTAGNSIKALLHEHGGNDDPDLPFADAYTAAQPAKLHEAVISTAASGNPSFVAQEHHQTGSSSSEQSVYTVFPADHSGVVTGDKSADTEQASSREAPARESALDVVLADYNGRDW